MLKEYVLLLLVSHLLGDFIFQSEKWTKSKTEKFRYVLLHSSVYAGTAFAISLPFFSKDWITALAIFTLSHFIVDSIKFLIIKKSKRIDYFSYRVKTIVFVIDQTIHIAVLFSIAAALVLNGARLTLLPQIEGMMSFLGIHSPLLLSWLVLLIAVGKPFNITIKHFIIPYRPQENLAGSGNSAGAFIGTLERLLIVVFLSVGQYAAIGLVLTAKSIARYQKIVEDKEFAEYYLLGTLLSVFLVIVLFRLNLNRWERHCGLE